MTHTTGSVRPGFEIQGSLDEVPSGLRRSERALLNPFSGFRFLSPAV